jgi:hypothetical protein
LSLSAPVRSTGSGPPPAASVTDVCLDETKPVGLTFTST